MGCCSSRDDNDDADDDVLVYPIRGHRSNPPPQVVSRQPEAPQTRHFLFLEPSHLQTITTTSTYLRPPPVSPPANRSRVQPGPIRRPPNANRIVRGNCEACGQSDHLKAECRYRTRLCFYCREEGHIISVCPKKRRKGAGRGRGRGGQRRGH